MQWFAIVCLLILLVWGGTVNSILAFTFCAIISFVFVRNLFESDIELDFTRIFATDGLRKQNGCSVQADQAKSLPPSLAKCRETAIKHILRDFVVSWFQNVGIEKEFVSETQELLVEATENLYEKVARTDITSYTDKLCVVTHKHFHAFQVAKSSMKTEDEFMKAYYQSLEGKPSVYRNNELSYLRTVVDLLLHKLVKKKSLDCDTGRFILREILAVNLFLPLLDFLSDPDFVNMSIINVLGEGRQDNEMTSSSEGGDLSESGIKTSAMSMEGSESEEKKIDSNFLCGSDVGNSVENESYIKQNDRENGRNPMKQDIESINVFEVLSYNNENHGFNTPRTRSNLKIPYDRCENGRSTSKERGHSLNKEQTTFISTSHVNQSMANTNFKNGKGSQGCMYSNPGVKSSILRTPTPSKCNENCHSSPIHQTQDKPNLGNEHWNNSDKKENSHKYVKTKQNDSGSKFVKVLLSTKIHPGILMFSKNIKCFDVPSVQKDSGEMKLGHSLPETFSLNDSVAEEHSKRCRSNESLHQLNRSLNLSRTEDGEDSSAGINIPKKQPISEPEQDAKRSGSTSSFEEIDVHNDSSKDNYNQTKAESDHCHVIKNDDTGKDAELKEALNEDESYVLEKDFNSVTKRQPILSLSSSADDWDDFEQLHDYRFPEDESDFLGDYSDHQKESGQEDISSLGEFAIPEVENPYLMISIPTTTLVDDHSWEPHKRKYTVYQIMFSLKLWPDQFKYDSADTDSEQLDNTNQSSIKRRYREFMELHHRLSCGPHASYLKDVPRPDRKFNSPFFRLGQDVIEGRQNLLESYLKCLVNKPAILNCDDFKGFLGIGNQTNFHRQMVEVPRIDKKLRKEVNKLIGHIKTAFETGPIDGDKEEEYKHIHQILGEDKTSQDEIRTLKFCSGDCELNHSCCYSTKCFQTYIKQKQESSDAESLETKSKIKITKLKKSVVVEATVSGTNNLETDKDHQITYPLTMAVLNLSCEILQKQESWVCLEPVQQAATAVFGYVFEWWLESLVSELITEEQWHYYLTLLTETIWPQGKLIKLNKFERTEEMKEKAKEEAVQTLSDFFGGVLHAAIGTDGVKASAREIVDSLQYPEINRQLLMEVLEVTLVEVFPTIVSDEEMYLSTRSC